MEVCVDSVQSAINAVNGGATRLELCSSLSLGGLTPSVGLLKTVRAKVRTTPIFVMIRPRAGNDFIYSSLEMDVMEQDIKSLGRNGADGFVFGALKSESSIDSDFCVRLLAKAGEIPCTFHRAFDFVANPLDSLEQLISLGFQRVLTSGQASSAALGVGLIHRLQTASNGRIIIMPGGGITSRNLHYVLSGTNATEFHGSAKTKVQLKIHPLADSLDASEPFVWETDEKEVREMQGMEIFADTLEGALVAHRSGAARILLCSGLPLGGLTPSLGLLIQVKLKIFGTPIICRIKPRHGRNYNYSPDELDVMEHDIKILKKHGADGFCFGALNEDYTLDENTAMRLKLCAGKKPVYFDRCFDIIPNPFEVLKTLIGFGYKGVVTSGREPCAQDGIVLIEIMRIKHEGLIDIIATGNITSKNLGIITAASGVSQLQADCRTERRVSAHHSNETEYIMEMNEGLVVELVKRYKALFTRKCEEDKWFAAILDRSFGKHFETLDRYLF